MPLYYRTKKYISKIVYLAIVGAIVGFVFAGIGTIWAPFIKGFVLSDAKVGIVTAILAAISFLSSFVVIPILENGNKKQIYIYSLIIIAASYILFSLVKSFALFFIIAIIETIAIVFKLGSFGVMIRNEAKLKDIGKTEGLRYSLLNVGYVLGPLVAGFVAARFDIGTVFVFSAIIFLIALLFFTKIKVKEPETIRSSDYNLFKNFGAFFSDKAKIKAYLLKGGMAVWWGIVYIFLPLLIINRGLGIEWTGIAIFALNVPLIVLEYPISKIADKKGYKNFFIFGFLILALISLFIFLFFTASIYLIIALFVLASIGAAFIEPLSEAYFFKITPQKEENKYYVPFLTAIDVSHTVARAIAALIVILLGFNYIFLFLCFEMLFFMIVAFGLKKV